MRIIETEADLAEGAAHLAAACPRMAHALSLTGPPPLRRRAEGFAALLHSIVSQQVSTAAAAGIWARMEAAGLTGAAAIAAADEDALRAAGLSRAKARYAQALAAARLDYPALGAMEEEEAVATLTAVPGVGRWTAEIYLMFAVGRADIFAPGDLALREAARALYGLEERPSIAALDAMAESWRPWRAVAARILFAYYRVLKGREGVA
ncbi:MAG: DNA-3-methyladenine glycosylase family protein [Pikeienuella sp.]